MRFVCCQRHFSETQRFTYSLANSLSLGGSGGYVDYKGARPTYEHFGGLVRLVPLLQVIRAGYDVISIDIENAFIKV